MVLINWLFLLLLEVEAYCSFVLLYLSLSFSFHDEGGFNIVLCCISQLFVIPLLPLAVTSSRAFPEALSFK